MSTYGLIPTNSQRVVPAGARLLPLFLLPDLARAYRATHGWTHDCEIAELPALEVLRAMLEARQQGVARVVVNPVDDGRPRARVEFDLDDPWSAFVELLHMEQAAVEADRCEEIPGEGFSDPRMHHERPAAWAASLAGMSEYDAAVVDLTAAQLLSLAGSVELAKHALDIVSAFAEGPTDSQGSEADET